MTNVENLTRLVGAMNRERQKYYEGLNDPDILICRILHLIVHPDHQRRGHGSAILSKLCGEMDTHKAYGITTAPSNLVGWYRKFGFEVFARLKGPFDDLTVVVRKPAEVGDYQVPAPDSSAPGKLGILGDAASRAKDYALGLAYELFMPVWAEVIGTRRKRLGKHKCRMEGGETDALLKLYGRGKGLPGKRVYDRYAEGAWDTLARGTCHDLVMLTTSNNKAAGEAAELHLERPVEIGHHTGQEEPTNARAEQPEPANGPTEDIAKPPKPANGHPEQPRSVESHTERLEPVEDGHVEHSRPEQEQAEQPMPEEAYAQENEPVQKSKKKYIATQRPDRKKRPTRRS